MKLIRVYKFLLISSMNFAAVVFLSAQTPLSWTQKADFPGPLRTGACSFVVKGYGFVGLGEDTTRQLLKDFWRYDPASNTWSQVADFGGTARKGAVGMGIDTMGYAGTGYDGIQQLKDFWQYDISLNAWTQVQDLGALRTSQTDGRRDATSIVSGSTGYLICGYNGSPGYAKETWQFNPSADTMWTKRKNFGNVSDPTYYGRRWSSGFSIDSMLYFGLGYSYSQDIKNDFWKYDPVADQWTQLADFGGGHRSNAISFSLYGKGYVGCGTGVGYFNDLWRYDPTQNSWLRMSDYGGSPMTGGVSFALLNNGYAGLGTDSMLVYHNDFWEYTPDSTIGINELSNQEQILISPNPASDFIRIIFTESTKPVGPIVLSIFNTSGSLVLKSKTDKSGNVPIAGLPAGVYYYGIGNGIKSISSGKLIILK